MSSTNYDYIDREDKVIRTTGCGCCSGVEPLTRESLQDFIAEREEQLAEARTLLAKMFPENP